MNQEDMLIEACSEIDALIVNLAPITEKVISAMKRCRVISRYGVGYDNVAIETATKKKIWVANVPDYCGEDVSDQALALLMSCVRNVARRDKLLRTGVWDIAAGGKQWRLKGKTFAFIGYGQIARILHRKLSGFLLGRILAYDPYVPEETVKSAGAEKVEFETALREADFISIHMPLNEKTRHIFNKKAFDKMKPTAIIINTSRGPIIDENAICEALSTHKILAAGIDVFETEPANKDNPLFKLDNITVSGHTGWYTEEAMAELKRKAAENVADVLEGRKPKYAVNNFT
jgi:D-3-phosphoglycerate dehydrogenase